MTNLRYALRRFARAPAFAASAVLVLAAGTGSPTAFCSVGKGGLIAPWPYAAPDRIVPLRGNFPPLGRADLPVFSAPEYDDLRQSGVFEHALAGDARNVNLINAGRAERVAGALM